MKKFGIIAAIALVLLSSCGTVRQTPEQKAEAQRMAKTVAELLDSRYYTIDVDYMIPLRGSSKPVDGSHFLAIEDNTITSNLPYVGQAQSVPYGGGKALNFTDTIQDYSDAGMKKGSREIVVKVFNGEDNLTYRITVFPNGTADIRVNCINRDDISYRGILHIVE